MKIYFLKLFMCMTRPDAYGACSADKNGRWRQQYKKSPEICG